MIKICHKITYNNNKEKENETEYLRNHYDDYEEGKTNVKIIS